MKKWFNYVFFMTFVTVASYGVYVNQKTDVMSDLILANVVALAEGETSTSWTCVGWWGSCSAYCGACGTKVEGDGHLEGTHSCSDVKN